jgi:hypothetical protein
VGRKNHLEGAPGPAVVSLLLLRRALLAPPGLGVGAAEHQAQRQPPLKKFQPLETHRLVVWG